MTCPFFMRWKPSVWPDGLDDNWCVYEPGIPGLRPKHWWDPRWRWQWPRRVYMVQTAESYHVYFTTDDRAMRTWWPVNTQLCSMRIGPRALRFCAVDARTGAQLQLVRLSNEFETSI